MFLFSSMDALFQAKNVDTSYIILTRFYRRNYCSFVSRLLCDKVVGATSSNGILYGFSTR